MRKKWLTWSNLSTVILLIFMTTMLINPTLKGMVIQSLMKIGLFQPDVTEVESKSDNAPFVKEKNKGILFKDEEGKLIDLADLRGKVVFINFWATWCPPCIAEMPSINKLKEKFKDNKEVVILMVDTDNKLEKSLKFMQKNKYSLTVFTIASPIPPAFLGTAIPTTILLNKNGEIVFKHEGSADYTNLEFNAFITKLSKE